MLGVAEGRIVVDAVAIEADNDAWVTEFEEGFAVTSGAVADEVTHDAAG